MELMNTRIFGWRSGKCSGLSKRMDIIILNPNCVIYNKPLAESRTIFINTRLNHKLIIKFIDEFLDLLDHPVNIIIAGEDYTFPNNTDKRSSAGIFPKVKLEKLINNRYVNKIFVENLDSHVPKTYPIPLGINPKECSTNITYFEKYRKIDINKALKFTNFNRCRNGHGQWEERAKVLHLSNTSWKKYKQFSGNLSHKQYLQELSKCLFTICVHGGGLDVNPKLFEALLVGVIPIIKENKPYTDLYSNLPVVIIDDWNEDTITYSNLLEWKNKYYKFHFEENYKKVLEILSLEYYVNKIYGSSSIVRNI